MMAGVTSVGPSQSTPLYGSREVRRGQPELGPVGLAAGRVNVPSAAAVAEATTLPSLTASTLCPASAFSLRVDDVAACRRRPG